MTNSSDSILVTNLTRDNAEPYRAVRGLEESFELADRFYRRTMFGAARACVWPHSRPNSANAVDVIVGMSNFLAVIDWAARDYRRATAQLASVSPLVETLRNRVLQGKYFNTYAICEASAGRFDSSFGYYRDSLDCYTLAGAAKYAGEVEQNIGALCVRMGDLERAEHYITKAVQSCTDELTMAQILDTRAKQQLRLGRYDEASMLITEAMMIASKLADVDVYLARFAKTFTDIRTAEVAQMEKTFA